MQHRLSLSSSRRISGSDCNCQRQNNSSIFPHCITILLQACQSIAGLHSPHVSRETFRTSTPISRLQPQSSFSSLFTPTKPPRLAEMPDSDGSNGNILEVVVSCVFRSPTRNSPGRPKTQQARRFWTVQFKGILV